MKFEILYQDQYETIDDIATKSEFIFKEPAPGGGFIETQCKNGIDLIDFMDREKVLADDEIPFPTTLVVFYELMRKFFPYNIGA
jgi:hypothetical protein